MRDQMTKGKDLNLDFGDISGGSTTVQPTTPVVQQVDKPVTIEPLGYEVALKSEEPGKFVFKDLAYVTGEEFVRWMEWVYPFKPDDVDPKYFESRVSKARAFENILKFHQSSIFLSKGGKALVH